MDPELREYFDERLDGVLEQLPAGIRQLLDDVPLFVEDYPSLDVLRRTGSRRHELCGLYTGIPITQKSIHDAGRASDVVWIFREGVLQLSSTSAGINQPELDRQIRITLLHELGHYHGLDEDDLERLGYG